MKVPPCVSLPSGLRVRLRVDTAKTSAPAPSTALAAALDQLDAGAVTLADDGGRPLGADALALVDFHALAAIFARAGLTREPDVEIACPNCDTLVRVRPSAQLELGPFVDDELDDPELDARFDFAVPLEIPAIECGRSEATTLRLRPVTVEQARPLLVRDPDAPLHIRSDVVLALGVAALGDERDPRRIARALSRATDAAFDAVASHFFDAHTTDRLTSSTPCPHCGAAIVVDAPYERELPIGPRAGAAEAFPSEDTFERAAVDIARPWMREAAGVSLTIDVGVAACDDGGVPLLGSYVPRFDGDATAPSRDAEITLYYRTFRAVWRDDGPYDWRAEVAETLAHELEHHASALAGHDETDLEERDAIAREALRVVGRKEIARRVGAGFAADVGEFFRRTWPVWLLALAALAIGLLQDK